MSETLTTFNNSLTRISVVQDMNAKQKSENFLILEKKLIFESDVSTFISSLRDIEYELLNSLEIQQLGHWENIILRIHEILLAYSSIMLDISVLKYNEVIECKARILQLLSFIKVLLKRCQDKQSYKNYDVITNLLMVLDFDIVEACVEVIYEKCIPVLSIAEYTTTEIEYKDNIELPQSIANKTLAIFEGLGFTSPDYGIYDYIRASSLCPFDLIDSKIQINVSTKGSTDSLISNVVEVSIDSNLEVPFLCPKIEDDYQLLYKSVSNYRKICDNSKNPNQFLLILCILRAAASLNSSVNSRLRIIMTRLRCFYILLHSRIPVDSIQLYLSSGCVFLKDLIVFSDINSEVISEIRQLTDKYMDISFIAMSSLFSLLSLITRRKGSQLQQSGVLTDLGLRQSSHIGRNSSNNFQEVSWISIISSSFNACINLMQESSNFMSSNKTFDVFDSFINASHELLLTCSSITDNNIHAQLAPLISSMANIIKFSIPRIQEFILNLISVSSNLALIASERNQHVNTGTDRIIKIVNKSVESLSYLIDGSPRGHTFTSTFQDCDFLSTLGIIIDVVGTSYDFPLFPKVLQNLSQTQSAVLSLHDSLKNFLMNMFSFLSRYYKLNRRRLVNPTDVGIQIVRQKSFQVLCKKIFNADCKGSELLWDSLFLVLKEAIDIDPPFLNEVLRSGYLTDTVESIRLVKSNKGVHVYKFLNSFSRLVKVLCVTMEGQTFVLEQHLIRFIINAIILPSSLLPNSIGISNDTILSISRTLVVLLRDVEKIRESITRNLQLSLVNICKEAHNIADLNISEVLPDEIRGGNDNVSTNFNSSRMQVLQKLTNICLFENNLYNELRRNVSTTRDLFSESKLSALVNAFICTLPPINQIFAQVGCRQAFSSPYYGHTASAKAITTILKSAAAAAPQALLPILLKAIDAILNQISGFKLELRAAHSPVQSSSPSSSSMTKRSSNKALELIVDSDAFDQYTLENIQKIRKQRIRGSSLGDDSYDVLIDGILDAIPHKCIFDPSLKVENSFSNSFKASIYKFISGILYLEWLTFMLSYVLRPSPYLNPKHVDKDILRRLFAFHKSSLLEICRFSSSKLVSKSWKELLRGNGASSALNDSFAELDSTEDTSYIPRVPDIYEIRVVTPTGAILREDCEIEGSRVTSTAEYGQIYQATERSQSSSGIVRYCTPDGWISESRKESHFDIIEILNVLSVPKFESSVEESGDSLENKISKLSLSKVEKKVELFESEKERKARRLNEMLTVRETCCFALSRLNSTLRIVAMHLSHSTVNYQSRPTSRKAQSPENLSSMAVVVSTSLSKIVKGFYAFPFNMLGDDEYPVSSSLFGLSLSPLHGSDSSQSINSMSMTNSTSTSTVAKSNDTPMKKQSPIPSRKSNQRMNKSNTSTTFDSTKKADAANNKVIDKVALCLYFEAVSKFVVLPILDDRNGSLNTHFLRYLKACNGFEGIVDSLLFVMATYYDSLSGAGTSLMPSFASPAGQAAYRALPHVFAVIRRIIHPKAILQSQITLSMTKYPDDTLSYYSGNISGGDTVYHIYDLIHYILTVIGKKIVVLLQDKLACNFRSDLQLEWYNIIAELRLCLQENLPAPETVSTVESAPNKTSQSKPISSEEPTTLEPPRQSRSTQRADIVNSRIYSFLDNIENSFPSESPMLSQLAANTNRVSATALSHIPAAIESSGVSAETLHSQPPSQLPSIVSTTVPPTDSSSFTTALSASRSSRMQEATVDLCENMGFLRSQILEAINITNSESIDVVMDYLTTNIPIVGTSGTIGSSADFTSDSMGSRGEEMTIELLAELNPHLDPELLQAARNDPDLFAALQLSLNTTSLSSMSDTAVVATTSVAANVEVTPANMDTSSSIDVHISDSSQLLSSNIEINLDVMSDQIPTSLDSNQQFVLSTSENAIPSLELGLPVPPQPITRTSPTIPPASPESISEPPSAMSTSVSRLLEFQGQSRNLLYNNEVSTVRNLRKSSIVRDISSNDSDTGSRATVTASKLDTYQLGLMHDYAAKKADIQALFEQFSLEIISKNFIQSCLELDSVKIVSANGNSEFLVADANDYTSFVCQLFQVSQRLNNNIMPILFFDLLSNLINSLNEVLKLETKSLDDLKLTGISNLLLCFLRNSQIRSQISFTRENVSSLSFLIQQCISKILLQNSIQISAWPVWCTTLLVILYDLISSFEVADICSLTSIDTKSYHESITDDTARSSSLNKSNDTNVDNENIGESKTEEILQESKEDDTKGSQSYLSTANINAPQSKLHLTQNQSNPLSKTLSSWLQNILDSLKIITDEECMTIYELCKGIIKRIVLCGSLRSTPNGVDNLYSAGSKESNYNPSNELQESILLILSKLVSIDSIRQQFVKDNLINDILSIPSNYRSVEGNNLYLLSILLRKSLECKRDVIEYYILDCVNYLDQQIAIKKPLHLQEFLIKITGSYLPYIQPYIRDFIDLIFKICEFYEIVDKKPAQEENSFKQMAQDSEVEICVKFHGNYSKNNLTLLLKSYFDHAPSDCNNVGSSTGSNFVKIMSSLIDFSYALSKADTECFKNDDVNVGVIDSMYTAGDILNVISDILLQCKNSVLPDIHRLFKRLGANAMSSSVFTHILSGSSSKAMKTLYFVDYFISLYFNQAIPVDNNRKTLPNIAMSNVKSPIKNVKSEIKIQCLTATIRLILILCSNSKHKKLQQQALNSIVQNIHMYSKPSQHVSKLLNSIKTKETETDSEISLHFQMLSDEKIRLEVLSRLIMLLSILFKAPVSISSKSNLLTPETVIDTASPLDCMIYLMEMGIMDVLTESLAYIPLKHDYAGDVVNTILEPIEILSRPQFQRFIGEEFKRHDIRQSSAGLSTIPDSKRSEAIGSNNANDSIVDLAQIAVDLSTAHAVSNENRRRDTHINELVNFNVNIEHMRHLIQNFDQATFLPVPYDQEEENDGEIVEDDEEDDDEDDEEDYDNVDNEIEVYEDNADEDEEGDEEDDESHDDDNDNDDEDDDEDDDEHDDPDNPIVDSNIEPRSHARVFSNRGSAIYDNNRFIEFLEALSNNSMSYDPMLERQSRNTILSHPGEMSSDYRVNLSGTSIIDVNDGLQSYITPPDRIRTDPLQIVMNEIASERLAASPEEILRGYRQSIIEGSNYETALNDLRNLRNCNSSANVAIGTGAYGPNPNGSQSGQILTQLLPGGIDSVFRVQPPVFLHPLLQRTDMLHNSTLPSQSNNYYATYDPAGADLRSGNIQSQSGSTIRYNSDALFAARYPSHMIESSVSSGTRMPAAARNFEEEYILSSEEVMQSHAGLFTNQGTNTRSSHMAQMLYSFSPTYVPRSQPLIDTASGGNGVPVVGRTVRSGMTSHTDSSCSTTSSANFINELVISGLTTIINPLVVRSSNAALTANALAVDSISSATSTDVPTETIVDTNVESASSVIPAISDVASVSSPENASTNTTPPSTVNVIDDIDPLVDSYIRSDLVEAETIISENNAVIAVNNELVSRNTDAIRLLNEAIEANNLQISRNIAEITERQSILDTNISRMTENSEFVNQNNQSIQQLNNEIEINNRRISEMQNFIDSSEFAEHGNFQQFAADLCRLEDSSSSVLQNQIDPAGFELSDRNIGTTMLSTADSIDYCQSRRNSSESIVTGLSGGESGNVAADDSVAEESVTSSLATGFQSNQETVGGTSFSVSVLTNDAVREREIIDYDDASMMSSIPTSESGSVDSSENLDIEVPSIFIEGLIQSDEQTLDSVLSPVPAESLNLGQIEVADISSNMHVAVITDDMATMTVTSGDFTIIPPSALNGTPENSVSCMDEHVEAATTNAEEPQSAVTEPEIPFIPVAVESTQVVPQQACPPGYDSDVFFSLPESMQQEILEQYSQTNQQTRHLIEASGYDYDMFTSLPENIQQEILDQARREHINNTSGGNGVAGEVSNTSGESGGLGVSDNSVFLLSLTSELREEILITADELFLETLTPSLRAEAQTARERAARRIQDQEIQSRGPGRVSRAQAQPNPGRGSNGPLADAGIFDDDMMMDQVDELMYDSTRTHNRLRAPVSDYIPRTISIGSVSSTTNSTYANGVIRLPPDEVEKLSLPNHLLAIITKVLCATSAKINITVLQQILCNLCKNSFTRDVILRLLLSILANNHNMYIESLLKLGIRRNIAETVYRMLLLSSHSSTNDIISSFGVSLQKFPVHKMHTVVSNTNNLQSRSSSSCQGTTIVNNVSMDELLLYTGDETFTDSNSSLDSSDLTTATGNWNIPRNTLQSLISLYNILISTNSSVVYDVLRPNQNIDEVAIAAESCDDNIDTTKSTHSLLESMISLLSVDSLTRNAADLAALCNLLVKATLPYEYYNAEGSQPEQDTSSSLNVPIPMVIVSNEALSSLCEVLLSDFCSKKIFQDVTLIISRLIRVSHHHKSVLLSLLISVSEDLIDQSTAKLNNLVKVLKRLQVESLQTSKVYDNSSYSISSAYASSSASSPTSNVETALSISDKLPHNSLESDSNSIASVRLSQIPVAEIGGKQHEHLLRTIQSLLVISSKDKETPTKSHAISNVTATPTATSSVGTSLVVSTASVTVNVQISTSDRIIDSISLDNMLPLWSALDEVLVLLREYIRKDEDYDDNVTPSKESATESSHHRSDPSRTGTTTAVSANVPQDLLSLSEIYNSPVTATLLSILMRLLPAIESMFLLLTHDLLASVSENENKSESKPAKTSSIPSEPVVSVGDSSSPSEEAINSPVEAIETEAGTVNNEVTIVNVSTECITQPSTVEPDLEVSADSRIDGSLVESGVVTEVSVESSTLEVPGQSNSASEVTETVTTSSPSLVLNVTNSSGQETSFIHIVTVPGSRHRQSVSYRRMNIQLFSDINNSDDIVSLQRTRSLITSYSLTNSLNNLINNGSGTKSNQRGYRLLAFIQHNKNLLNLLIKSKPDLLETSFSAFIRIVQLRPYLSFENKRHYFTQQLQQRLRQAASHRYHGSVHLHLRRDSLFEDSYDQLRSKSISEWLARFQVNFHDEQGIDAGGLTREWFSVLSREIFNPNYALFTSSDGSTFQPNPFSNVNSNHLSYFKFVGNIIGKAICDGQLMDAHFTRSFYKHVLGIPVDYTDIEATDPDYYKILKQILDNRLEDLMIDLTFSAETQKFGKTEVDDLIPNGRNIAVTDDNKFEYIRLISHHRMTTAIQSQINAFLDGFYDLVPAELITIFSPTELELVICGLPDVDIDNLKENTEYHGFKYNDEIIGWFWDALKSFSRSEKASFIQFVTGTSKVPLGGFANLQGMRGIQKCSIHRAYSDHHQLPTAHTCFNQLDLPCYTSAEELRNKLLLAIREGSEGFGFA